MDACSMPADRVLVQGCDHTRVERVGSGWVTTRARRIQVPGTTVYLEHGTRDGLPHLSYTTAVEDDRSLEARFGDGGDGDGDGSSCVVGPQWVPRAELLAWIAHCLARFDTLKEVFAAVAWVRAETAARFVARLGRKRAALQAWREALMDEGARRRASAVLTREALGLAGFERGAREAVVRWWASSVLGTPSPESLARGVSGDIAGTS
jgi:hypothetical protein